MMKKLTAIAILIVMLLSVIGAANAAAEIKATLKEGQTDTYNVNGADYEITAVDITSNSAKLRINGEELRIIKVGESDKIADGSLIKIISVDNEANPALVNELLKKNLVE